MLIVIKYGGNAMINESAKRQVLIDAAEILRLGHKPVIVHGGGPEINKTAEALGKEATFVNGLRVTDAETMNIVQMVLCGKVNKDLVRILNSLQVNAVGISGIDSGMIQAEIKDEKLGYVGNVTKVNTALIETLLESGYIPVIATIACDKDGNAYNINGDTAASAVAAALNADKLIMLTDIPGILRDIEDKTSLINTITESEAEALTNSGIISGGMIPKTESCLSAVRAGVKAVVITDGTVPGACIDAVNGDGIGTTFIK